MGRITKDVGNLAGLLRKTLYRKSVIGRLLRAICAVAEEGLRPGAEGKVPASMLRTIFGVPKAKRAVVRCPWQADHDEFYRTAYGTPIPPPPVPITVVDFVAGTFVCGHLCCVGRTAQDVVKEWCKKRSPLKVVPGGKL